ncbi:rhomboid family intramembrane serine protease [Meridianimarinicoccus aquatilis]|uniref:Rhomboid family intramembrane serine protease n=1 Tax=Meridianimarinicoccus aquatilis TaxID=2552766 RepID=A0A4R6B5S0_9RHOB|nr:rhomboid family intramembrane serine protease [Fluviibacterium aquatile]QIE41420.1 rhomboid family intramembrane serine protease [Rhodobacteraceae bacterium SC52]TDL91443.1 rhomboid family intramembrane serine protease [Fluviibacterium aquatile]
MPTPQPIRPNPPQGPVNPLPKSVIALAVVIVGVELLFNLADRGILGGASGIGLRAGAIRDYGFYGDALKWMLANGQFPLDLLVRFVTYPLLHFSFTHALFVCVFVLAMGKMVGEALGDLAVVTIFFGSSIGGALVYGLLLNDQFPLVGGYPGVYGLIGGYTFLSWVQARLLQQSQVMAFRLIGMLLGVQLLFGLLFGSRNDWLADLSGFAVGFALCFLLVPGGWARLRDVLRNR